VAPTPNGYRTGGGALYNNRQTNGAHNTHVHNGSESMLYGQGPGPKNVANSREGTPANTVGNGGVRAMMVYDRDQSQRVGDREDDGHGGHGRQRGGFFGIICCRD